MAKCEVCHKAALELEETVINDHTLWVCKDCIPIGHRVIKRSMTSNVKGTAKSQIGNRNRGQMW